MEFKNRENEYITKDNIGDRGFFHSRSVAVVGVIIARHKDNVYVLVERRGPKMDKPNEWCVPCGYMDWDENGTGAIFREIYEETNLNMDEFINDNRLVYEALKQPWFVHDTPFAHRQNITLRYGCCVDVLSEELPEVSNVNVGTDETAEVKWINVVEVGSKKYNFAFNHDEVISQFIQIVLNHFGMSK